MTDLTVHVTKTIQAPIDEVFRAWLDPEKLSQFILPQPGMPHPETKVDARVGGEFQIIMQVGDNKIPHTGEYMEISEPNTIAFSWNSPFSIEGSLVTINFSAISDKETLVELSHVNFIDEQSRANHEGGWSNILNSLEDLCG